MGAVLWCLAGGEVLRQATCRVSPYSHHRSHGGYLFAGSFYYPSLPPLLLFVCGKGNILKFSSKKNKDCHRDKDLDTTSVTSVEVEVKTITRHQRRENGRRTGNFAIKNDDLIKNPLR